MAKILFNTANLVARFSGYRFTVSDWGGQEKKTIEATSDAEFAKICSEIKACGYDAVELWFAHCHHSKVTIDGAKARRKIAADQGLTIEAMAGGYTRANLDIGEALGVKCINGGFWGIDFKSVKDLVKGSSIAFNYENHPEKTPEEIIEKIEGGSEKIGVALDTGWLATSATVDTPSFISRLGKLLRHIHLKDVAEPGGHHTAPLGTGCVGIDAVIKQMKSSGYAGMWSWEDEPEDRNPFDVAVEMRKYIASRI